MTQQGYRHRVIIQDRSGSMNDILDGAQDGLDEFLATEARTPGRVTVSLWDFDTLIRCVHSFASPDAVLGYQIVPRLGTDLYGAVGTAVNAEGLQLAELPEDERPEDVTVIIASDGKHNTTVLYTGRQAQALLAQQQDTYNWRVLYMGCGKAAFDEAENIGARAGLTVNTARSDAGQRNAWKMSSNYLKRAPVAAAAAGQGVSLDFSEEERALGESGAEEGDTGEE